MRSIQARQSRRLDLSVLRAGFVLAAMGWGVTATLSFSQSGAVLHLGHRMVFWFYPASVIFLAYLAGRLNRETVGDATSGYLSLISLTGTTSTAWTLTRFVQNWIGFLSAWVVRLPFVFLFFTLGGIRFHELLLCEAVFLALFAAVSSRSMLAAHNTDNRKGSDWSGIGTIFVLEIVLNLGRIIAAVLAAIGVIVPNVLLEAGELMSSVSLLNWFANVAGGGLLPVNPLGMLAIYSSLTLYWLFKYRKVLYDRIGETPEPALESKKEKTKALKKRPPLERCWENALGWQSYVYYAGGHDNTTGRVILYGAALLFVLFSLATQMLVPLMVIVLIGSGIVFLNAMNGTTHCFDKESKANTLGSLMMTPHNGLDLYRGWRSGILWLTIPDHVYLAIVTVAMLFIEPWVSYVILCLMITIHLSGPLLMLSGLVPIALKGLGTALLVLFGVLLCAFFGVLVAWLMHPAAFPLGFMPLYAIFNSILLHYFVEHWLIIKIADEV